jgi:hypothetical protein
MTRANAREEQIRGNEILVVIDIQTWVSEASLHRRKSMLTLAFGCILGATMWIPVAFPEWTGWTTPLLVVVPGLLTMAVMPSSTISAAYLALTTLTFGVTSMLLGSTWQPRLVSTVLAWSLAIAAGTLMGGTTSQRRSPTSGSWKRMAWTHYALCGGLIGVSVFLALTSGSGYEAQLMTGLTTPTGILGTLSVAAPFVTLILVLSAIKSDRRMIGAIVLSGAQMLALALSGFRSAAGDFILAILVGAALTLPRGSVWRRKSRLLIVMPVLLMLTISTFMLGSNVRNEAASRLGISSSGTRLFTLDNAAHNTLTRLQLGSSLGKAIEFQNDKTAKAAVSWTTQFAAVIPRFLWPEKPIVDYGQRVSVAIYGYTYGQSSSTVTTVGDSLLNFGLVGLVLIGFLAGYAFRRFEMRLRSNSGWLSVVVGIVIVYSVLDQESPVILIIIGILRNFLVTAGLWAAATLIANIKRTRGSRTTVAMRPAIPNPTTGSSATFTVDKAMRHGRLSQIRAKRVE